MTPATNAQDRALSSGLLIKDGFYKGAKALRQDFEDVFSDPKKPEPRRFCWDHWHVPRQYKLLRTPAAQFFNKKAYEPLHEAIAHWGRENLGCHDISPIWLSCYLDDHWQNLHGDLPHGPWAFVLSLSPDKATFRGGETLLLKEKTLDFWTNYLNGKFEGGLEEDKLFHRVTPKFNRLVVFDGRVPHGVAPVRGPMEVCEGRLVLHGWFLQPRPFIEGPLSSEELQNLYELLAQGMELLHHEGVTELRGALILRFEVRPNGTVSSTRILTNLLRGPDHSVKGPLVAKNFLATLAMQKFRKQKTASRVTLPILFEP